jgi:hypothetical protein
MLESETWLIFQGNSSRFSMTLMLEFLIDSRRKVDIPSFILNKKIWRHCLYYSFKTRPGHQPGPVTGSRVRWVDPGQPKKKLMSRRANLSINCKAFLNLICLENQQGA